MHRHLAALVLSCCLLTGGCATARTPRQALVGSYRHGHDPDNAEYLVLNRDGSFGYSEVASAAAGFDHVAPFAQGQETGRWQAEGQEVRITPLVTHGSEYNVRRYKIIDQGGKRELCPMYGAGYVAVPGFVPITEEESTRHSLLNLTPTSH